MRRLLIGFALFGLLVLGAPRAQVRAEGSCIVPKSWGRLVAMTEWSAGGAMTGTRLAFEATDGTIRIVSSRCEIPPMALVVLRGEN